LDAGLAHVNDRIDAALATTTGHIDALGGRIDALSARVDSGFAAVNARLDAHIERHTA
jgi:hypothetical protein